MKLVVSVLLGALAGVDAQADLSKNPCAGSQFKQVWCDSSRSIEDRVTALVANMTVAEKAGLFVMNADSVPRLDIPA
jgi:hypothetical protein